MIISIWKIIFCTTQVRSRAIFCEERIWFEFGNRLTLGLYIIIVLVNVKSNVHASFLFLSN